MTMSSLSHNSNSARSNLKCRQSLIHFFRFHFASTSKKMLNATTEIHERERKKGTEIIYIACALTMARIFAKANL